MLNKVLPMAEISAWMSIFDFILCLVVGGGAFLLTAGLALALGLLEPLDLPGLFQVRGMRLAHWIAQAVLSLALVIALDVLILNGAFPREVLTSFAFGWVGAMILVAHAARCAKRQDILLLADG